MFHLPRIRYGLPLSSGSFFGGGSGGGTPEIKRGPGGREPKARLKVWGRQPSRARCCKLFVQHAKAVRATCFRSPGQVCGASFGRLWPSYCERIKIRSQTPRAFGPDNLRPDSGAHALALRAQPARNRPRKPGPGTASNIKQPKVFVPGLWPRKKRSPSPGRPPPRESQYQIPAKGRLRLSPTFDVATCGCRPPGPPSRIPT